MMVRWPLYVVRGYVRSFLTIHCSVVESISYTLNITSIGVIIVYMQSKLYRGTIFTAHLGQLVKHYTLH